MLSQTGLDGDRSACLRFFVQQPRELAGDLDVVVDASGKCMPIATDKCSKGSGTWLTERLRHMKIICALGSLAQDGAKAFTIVPQALLMGKQGALVAYPLQVLGHERDALSDSSPCKTGH